MSQFFFQLPCALVEVTQLAEILYANAEGYFIVHWGEGGGRRREKKEEKRKKKIKERKKEEKKRRKWCWVSCLPIGLPNGLTTELH